MADWEEIKRLAADFQRAQLSESSQKLSERNCIEIVNRLQKLGLIEVVYTCDGKEYLTPAEVCKEIREELQVHAGRINLADLQKAINIDYSHVEAKVNSVLHGDKSLSLVLGDLIDESYIDGIADEVNDKLQELGHVSIAQVTKDYNLPADYLSKALIKRIGKIIHGNLDDYDQELIYTDAYIARHTARLRGALSALTQPLPVSTILQTCDLPERLFYKLVGDLVSLGRIAGSVSGARQDKTVYVPDIYVKAQQQWADNFLKQNGYLEYDALARLGIADSKSFVKKRYKDQELISFTSCCILPHLLDQAESSIDEAVSTCEFIDVAPLLPSGFTDADKKDILQRLLKNKSGVTVMADTFVVPDQLLKHCLAAFDDVMAKKADQDVRANPALLLPDKLKSSGPGGDDGHSKEDRRDQRRKKAAGSSSSNKGSKGGGGSGSQGREFKTKATKKKGGPTRGGDSDDETDATPRSQSGLIPFLSPEEIEVELKKLEKLKECPEELLQDLAEHLERPLTRQYQEIVRSVFLQSVSGGPQSGKKRSHSEMTDKINGLYTNVRLFDKAIPLFPDDVQQQLSRHLLRTICSEIANLLFQTAATDNMVSLAEATQLTPETRLKILTKVSDTNLHRSLSKLNATLNEKSVDEFVECLESVCVTSAVDVTLRKADKKKERQLIFQHKHALVEQLENETDPAMTLHLACVLLFQSVTSAMVHAPGRCVPHLVSFLQQHMPPEQHQVLVQCQEMVIQQIKQSSNQNDNDSSNSSISLDDKNALLAKVKEIAMTTKKSTTSSISES